MARRQERQIRAREREVSIDTSVLAVTQEEKKRTCAALSGSDVTGVPAEKERKTWEGSDIMRDTWTR